MPLTLNQIVEIAAADNEFTMATPSDDIFYANQQDERLTDVIATIADEVLDKADASHTHSGYAASNHTHSGYAASSHSHSDKADLVDGKVPASQLPSFVDDVLEYTALANFPTTGESGKIYIDQTTNKTYRWSGSAYVEISASLALGETASTAYRGDRGATAYTHSQNGDVHVTAAQKTAWDAKSNFSGSYNDLTNKPTIPSAYTHPSYTAKSSGLYKVTVDATGHVSAATAVTKADITALGIPASDTNTTYSAATISAAGLMSASDKSKLDGIATGATKITVDSALSSSSTNPVQNKVINTALAGKAASSHTHALSAITGLLDLLATADDGDVEVSWSDQDVVAKIKALGSGLHTAYAKGGSTNNPKTTESWRFIVHKTGTMNYGWVIAFGSSGSVYTGYVDNASWKGWKCLYNATSNDMILWSGSAYMQSTNSTPQVVTPSKKLSQCRTGWMLLWSDYDPGDGANDSDFCTTFIPKFTPSGGTWGGKAFYCDIPMYVGSDATDLSTEKRCIKPVYVHDDCLKGSYQNTSGGRNDVVLRAVYEV